MALVAALTLAACSAPTDDTTDVPRSLPATVQGKAINDQVDQAEAGWTAEHQQVVDGYQAAMAALDQTLTAPVDTTAPAARATMVDPVLREVTDLAASWAGFGQALRYPEPSKRELDVLRIEIVGDEATVEVCRVDDAVVYEPATGRVLNDSVSTLQERAALRRLEGAWVLATRTAIEKWEGVDGCALAS